MKRVNEQIVWCVDIFDETEELTRKLFTKYFNYDELDKAEQYVDWYNGIFSPKKLPNTFACEPYRI